MENKREFTLEEAMQIGRQIGIKWHKINPNQFRMGLGVEMEHHTNNPQTNVAHDLVTVGKIALAHLEEMPDYYTRLDRMEREGKEAEKQQLEKACSALRGLAKKKNR